MVGVGPLMLGVNVGASDGWVGVLAEGAWFGSRGGSVEAAGAARGGRGGCGRRWVLRLVWSGGGVGGYCRGSMS